MERGEDPLVVDVRNGSDLTEVLSQVFLFAEHINALASLPIGHSLGHRKELNLRCPRDIPGLLLWLRDRMSRPGARWLAGSEILDLAHQVGINPTPNPAVLGALIRLLLRPAKVGPAPSGLNWKIYAPPEPLYLPRSSSKDAAERLSERISVYSARDKASFSNRPLLDRRPDFTKNLAVHYWEEPFDSINVVRLFLSEVLGERGRGADQHLQRWLRRQFCLSYDETTKYALAGICQRFNLIFYELAVPSTQIIHTKRAATIATSVLIEEISELLRQTASPNEDVNPRLYLRQALGLYLFLRFCRQLRCGYCWFDLQRLKDDNNSSARGRLETLNGIHFSSALRPTGYTYLQSRIFGMISNIPGLSNIFRGGLLPRTGSGRTLALIGPPGVGKTVLALQMMSDVASLGGLAVYFSFEESYSSILDRLITFGLYDPQKFQIEQAGSDFAEVLQKALAEDSRKGILVLYSDREEVPFSVLEAIDSISLAAEGRKAWRALVLDSVNALDFPKSSSNDDGSGRRLELGALISKIEQNKFLGVLLAEKDDRSLWTLPYLMDTVIELGLDDPTHMRWLEIKKCRVQDYHPGKHPFRMTDGRGVTIYPSLASRRSSLRGRVRSTASEQRFIPFPDNWRKTLSLNGVREKSSTLIWGPPGGGKTLLLLNLLTEHTWKRLESSESEKQDSDLGPPSNVLFVTFRTPEKNFLQNLERHPALYARWQRIRQVKIRWCSVGVNFSAEQLVSEIWRYFNSSRREGLAVDRVVFDETESAEDLLPALKNETLFWPTLFELTSTEAINSFFVCSSTGAEPPLMRLLRSSMDYVLHAYETATDPSTSMPPPEQAERWVAVEKHPDLVPGSHKMVVPLRAHSEKGLEGLIY